MRLSFRTILMVFFSFTALSLFARGGGESDRHWAQYVPSIEAGEEEGLIIVRVLEDSPAERAGLERGDIVLKINGQDVNTMSGIYKILKDLKGGDAIDLFIRHGDTEKAVNLILEDRLYRPPLGLVFHAPHSFSANNFPMFHMLGGGALVISVIDDSAAARAGLRRGDLIVSLGGEKVDQENTLFDLVGKYRPGDRVELEIWQLESELESGSDDSNDSHLVEVELGEGAEGRAFLGVRLAPAPRFKFHFSEDSDRAWRPRYRSRYRFPEYDQEQEQESPSTMDVTPEVGIEQVIMGRV